MIFTRKIKESFKAVVLDPSLVNTHRTCTRAHTSPTRVIIQRNCLGDGFHSKEMIANQNILEIASRYPT